MKILNQSGTRPPKGPSPPKGLIKPNYSARTPIVNDSNFTDGPRLPTMQSAQFNPGANASPLPNGPPRFIQPQGAKRVYAKGLTNKRLTQNI